MPDCKAEEVASAGKVECKRFIFHVMKFSFGRISTWDTQVVWRDEHGRERYGPACSGRRLKLQPESVAPESIGCAVYLLVGEGENGFAQCQSRCLINVVNA